MSTILKALRRLEEDKARGGAPRPLREEVAAGPRERPRRRGAPWMLLGALLLGGGLGASAWWFWPYERAAEPVEIAAAQAVAPAEPTASPDAFGAPGALAEAPGAESDTTLTEEQMLEQLQAVGAAESGDLPEDALESLVEVVERPPAEPRIAPVEPKPAVAAPERRVAVARRREQERAAVTETGIPATPARSAAAEPPAVSPPVRPAAGSSRPALASAPAPVAARPPPAEPVVPDNDRDWPVISDWEEKPAEIEPSRIEAPRSALGSSPAAQASAADVKVKRTQWHPEPARRSAELVLAGKDRSVHEGDVVGDYVVNEIRPSGVVLSRDGEQIERGIGK